MGNAQPGAQFHTLPFTAFTDSVMDQLVGDRGCCSRIKMQCNQAERQIEGGSPPCTCIPISVYLE